MSTAATWLQFDVAGSTYAIPLDAVTEVTAACRPHLIPLVPLSVGGVINVRGEPLPAVDGAVVLGGPAPSSEARHALILGEGRARVGVLVESVSRIERGLEDASADESEPPDPDAPSFVRWVRYRGTRIGLVDEQGLMNSAKSRLTGLPAAGEERRVQSKIGSTGEEACRNAF